MKTHRSHLGQNHSSNCPTRDPGNRALTRALQTDWQEGYCSVQERRRVVESCRLDLPNVGRPLWGLECREGSRLALRSGQTLVTSTDARRWVVALLKRASSSLTYPLLGPLFLRTSSYEQSCPN